MKTYRILLLPEPSPRNRLVIIRHADIDGEPMAATGVGGATRDTAGNTEDLRKNGVHPAGRAGRTGRRKPSAECRPLPLGTFAEWLANGEVGFSSLSIVQRLTGVRMTANGHRPEGCEDIPRDPDDLRRILLLLDAVPETRARLNLMRDVSKDWRNLIGHWNEIEGAYRREAPTGRAPKTYAMLKALREGTGNAQL